MISIRRGCLFGRLPGDAHRRAPVDDGATAAAAVPDACGGTDTGRLRDHNEDAFLCDPARGLLLVADGMGGHAAGELASAIVRDTLRAALTPARLDRALAGGEVTVSALLIAAIHQAHAEVLQQAAAQRDREGMGSTVVVALHRGLRLYLAHVGDSRAYLVRAGTATVLTHDHSVVAALQQRGEITAAEARTHPMRNRLTAVLGAASPLITPPFAAVALQPGDRVVLCSDGLWNMITEDRLAGIVTGAGAACRAVQTLIEAANAAGGADNITAVAVFVPDAPDASAA